MPRIRASTDPPWRWLGVFLLVGLLAGAGSLAGLAIVTSPVEGAPAIVGSWAASHHIHYPGPLPPRRFVDSLVATEDQRFYSPFDPGVDPIAILRVGLGHVAGLPDQGGSTIDQQLAKLLYSRSQQGFWIELKRVIIALKLSFTYSKPELLTMYAELAYYGHGFYGLEAASCGYFGKVPADLSWGQAAMLAGVVNAPSTDDPVSHPTTARVRQKHVFERLVAVGTLTTGQAKAALASPLDLIVKSGNPVGLACRHA